MDINPGGVLPPDQVLGRDLLVARYWEILRQRSLALVAPRRIGKSSILTLMNAGPPADMRFLLLNVEGRPSLGSFVGMLHEAASGQASVRTHLMTAANATLKRIAGRVDTPWLKLQLEPTEWHDILSAIFDDLQADAAKHDQIVVVAWDEFTWYLHDLHNDGNGRDAGLLLDRLRAIRQSRDHDRIRMCFTGSIGLEEVLDRLQEDRFVRDPMNDVDRQVVPVLDMAEALRLAGALVRTGAGQDLPAVATAIATSGEGHPYYIQHLAQTLKWHGTWTAQAVGPALDALVDGEQDRLELMAFIERIALYRKAEKATIEAVLDRVSTRPATVDELIAETGAERSALVSVLGFLLRDLYLSREGAHYAFQLDLLRRFWRRARGLS